MSFGTGWQRISRRVLAMDRFEIADRFRQQATARVDFLRSKAGADFTPELGAAPATQPQFFFSAQSVPALCSRLRQHFPETAQQIIERAERICLHHFDLLGYKDVDYGTDIDWHCDRVHGKRAPRKAWFKVKYLDFAEVGDSKVTWELNRHQHLVTLAKAYRLTGDEKFATEVFRQWHHWHAENPYPIGINWASSLEVAVRSLSWIWVYFLLADSPVLPSSFRTAWLRALAVSGRHIDCYLSTYFSPNTHLLGEAVALFFIGTLCPEIPAARRWRERGWKIVQQEAARQVRSDGFHFEQSTYYHVYALDFFLHAAVLASVNHVEVPKEFDRTVERMLEALAILSRAGAPPRLGDDDGGRLFDSSRNQAANMVDPLATGAVLLGRGDFKAIVGGPREETLWLLGEPGLEEFDRIAPASPPHTATALRASGLYVMTGNRGEWQLVMDAGPQGAHTAGHGHADALSLTASSPAGELLIDPGTFQYVGPDSERDRFRGTGSHSTLIIAGQDQAKPHGPFGWARLPTVRAEGWILGKTFDLFVGSHDGYSRLPNPVTHRRFVFALKSGFWMVRDLALGFGEYPLDLFWHLGYDLREEDPESGVFRAGDRALRFVTADGHGWFRTVEPQPGSPVYGTKQDHSVLHFATKTQLPAEFVTLVLPFADARSGEHSLTKHAAPSVVGYRCRAATDEHCIYYGQGEPWKLDGWSSDAEVFYSARIGETAAPTLICCNATYVEWEGRRIVTTKRPVLRCEIIGSEADVVSSDPEVTVDREAWSSFANGPRVVVKTS
ncbi:MAG TPA: alginate lyase family protein [Candidatus Dormibacteraeota bacterium]|nr:alginate lyase family protein [Candidatus Dormibacteraeota bacterium]